jgi:hypothetical protein
MSHEAGPQLSPLLVPAIHYALRRLNHPLPTTSNNGTPLINPEHHDGTVYYMYSVSTRWSHFSITVGRSREVPAMPSARVPRERLTIARRLFSFFSCLHAPDTSTHAQGYLQPPSCGANVSGHASAPQYRSNYAIIWGAYDMWLFRGSGLWSQCEVVHHCARRAAAARSKIDGQRAATPGGNTRTVIDCQSGWWTVRPPCALRLDPVCFVLPAACLCAG